MNSSDSSIEGAQSPQSSERVLVPLVSAFLIAFGSLILLQLAAVTRISGSCYLSTTFFWLFLLCFAGGVSAFLGRFFWLALSAAISMIVVGVFLLMSYPYTFGALFLLLALMGLVAATFLLMSRNDCSGGQARSIDVKRPPGSTSRNTAILRILTILVAVLLFAGIYSSYQICPYVNPRKGHYEVKITMSATSNFEMIVPEPVNESYELWDLVQSLTIKEGTASWQVVETFQGLGLRIAGEGNTTLRCEDLQDALPYYVLSPQNRSVSEWDSDHVPLLVYVNASRLEYMLGLSISASYQSRWMDLWTTLGSEPGDLVAGWQVIEGRQNLSVV